MTDSNEINIQDFLQIFESYEVIISQLIQELDEFKEEFDNNKITISKLLEENKSISLKLTKTENIKFKYHENDLIKNMQQQLNTVIEEKENAVKLWQMAIKNIDELEEELKLYQNKTQEFIPKEKLIKIKEHYEEKIRNLEQKLENTQKDLNEIMDRNESRKKEMNLCQTQENTLKIIQNLEEEILKLQDRQNDIVKSKNEIEKIIENKDKEIKQLKNKNLECRRKVEEAVQIVEAALNEKDSALLRENEAKDEIIRLSKTLEEVIAETEEKVKKEINVVKEECTREIERISLDLKLAQDQIRLKSVEIDKFSKECALLETEIHSLKHGFEDDNKTSKLLILEKNLENTFQKLLLSEKQNIQIASERDSIRNDLEQMASYYERDIKGRETEKVIMKSEIKKLKLELEDTYTKLTENTEYNRKLEDIERDFRNKLEESRIGFKEKYEEIMKKTNEISEKRIKDLQEQLILQIENNKKWRIETRNIIEKLEKRISVQKQEISKCKQENKFLVDKITEANMKINDYKNYLQIFSNDVNKITETVR